MSKVMLAAAAALFISTSAFAQQQAVTPPVGPDWSKVTVTTTDLGNRTYMLEGQGGNVTFAVGDDGIIMIDSQFAPMHDKLKAAITAVSPLPIKYMVNTHHHGDHSGGNAAFAADGVTVVGHINERDILAKGGTNSVSMQPAPAVSGAALPTQTYTDALTLTVKGRSAALKHPGSAHTGGDTYIYFADANVLSTGDTVTLGRYPNIDYLNGGSVKGMIAASDAYIALANDTTKIVPGHGPLANKAQIIEYRAFLVTARDRMAKLVAEGKSLDEVYAIKPYADFDTKLAANEQMAKNFMRVVYSSLKQQ